jgi:predicted phosphodiesterase
VKYAIIADIHANLPALNAVLADIKAQDCTHIACLGDIVGYYFHPKECLDIIRNMGIPCLKGNHDEYCSSASSPDGFNPRAAEILQWTRDQLTADDLQWLQALPYTLVVSGFTLVHATLNQPERWQYVFDKLAAEAHFQYQTTPVCFFGHTHVPVAFVRDTVIRGGTFSKLKIERDRRYFINVGSVGQPRDQNPKAAYVTYDLDAALIELRRVDYPKPDLGDHGGPGSPSRVSPGGGPSPLSASNEFGKA